MAKIVVVEDELQLRELLIDELKDVGHSIIEACDGLDGLASISETRPDIIISDIGMPREWL